MWLFSWILSSGSSTWSNWGENGAGAISSCLLCSWANFQYKSSSGLFNESPNPPWVRDPRGSLSGGGKRPASRLFTDSVSWREREPRLSRPPRPGALDNLGLWPLTSGLWLTKTSSSLPVVPLVIVPSGRKSNRYAGREKSSFAACENLWTMNKKMVGFTRPPVLWQYWTPLFFSALQITMELMQMIIL